VLAGSPKGFDLLEPVMVREGRRLAGDSKPVKAASCLPQGFAALLGAQGVATSARQKILVVAASPRALIAALAAIPWFGLALPVLRWLR
jgi:hypothetical protein